MGPKSQKASFILLPCQLQEGSNTLSVLVVQVNRSFSRIEGIPNGGMCFWGEPSPHHSPFCFQNFYVRTSLQIGAAFNKPEQCWVLQTCLRSLITAISSLHSCHSLPLGSSSTTSSKESFFFTTILPELLPKSLRQLPIQFRSLGSIWTVEKHSRRFLFLFRDQCWSSLASQARGWWEVWIVH